MTNRKKTIEPKPINAVIYARVSSTGDRQSTDRQVKDLTDYAVYKEYNVVNVYTEHISGAKKNGERPVLREAIERCKEYAQPLASEGNAKSRVILLVSELSRLGRNAFEVLETVKELIDNGINLYMQKEQMSLFGEDGKPSVFAPIMIATLSTCAQLERDNITFRLQSGYKQYREKGGGGWSQVWLSQIRGAEKGRVQGGHRLSEQGLYHQGCGKTQWKECQLGAKGKEIVSDYKIITNLKWRMNFQVCSLNRQVFRGKNQYLLDFQYHQ